MRDQGEASLAVMIAGAAVTVAPVVAITATEVGTGIAFWAGVCVAVLAAGTGMWKLVSVIYRWGRKVEQTFDAVADLQARAERMELRQLATSEQLRDVAERLDAGIEHSRRIFEVAERNRVAAEEHGINGLRPLPTD